MENIFQPTITHSYFTDSHKGGGLNSMIALPLSVSDHSIPALSLVRKTAYQ